MTKLTMRETGADYLAVLFADDPVAYNGADENAIMAELNDLDLTLEIQAEIAAELHRKGM